MKKKIRLVCLSVLATFSLAFSIQTKAAGKQTIYNSPYVSFSPDEQAWTTGSGNVEYTWYPKGERVETGIPSSLRALETGEHYYKEERTGEIPIGFWEVSWRAAQCIHNAYLSSGQDYHGLAFGRSMCGGYYDSGWLAYCADCGEPVTDMYMYMTREAAESIDYFAQDVGNGKTFDYYYLCPHCNNLEQGKTLKIHCCKKISWNRYEVQYDANAGENQGGYMHPSIHMYNNAREYEGEQITPATHLTKNNYTRQGYEFVGWNTKPDGNGEYFSDGQEILNLTAENREEGGAIGKGIVMLYAQWRPSCSKLVLDAAGGTYREQGKYSVSGEYLDSYVIDSSLINPPSGYTVSFEANGGSRVSAIAGSRKFTEWEQIQPFQGDFYKNRYTFIAPDGTTDTLRACYDLLPIILPKTVKSGYSLGGWYYDEAFTSPAGNPGEHFLPDKNLTLYAQWVELKLTSKENYAVNDGKGAVDLSWTQPDGKNKAYRLYQSKDGQNWSEVYGANDIGNSVSVSQTFAYNGKAGTWKVPYTGFYTLTAEGAQGASYGSFRGGYGGRVSAKMWLQEGEVLSYAVGGQNGYNGGGTGSDYGNGGGSTTVISDKKGLLLTAGGGGGAALAGNGGAGGSSTSLVAKAAGQNGMAGGGGGYQGGTAGEKIVHHHTDACYTDISGTNRAGEAFYAAGKHGASGTGGYGENRRYTKTSAGHGSHTADEYAELFTYVGDSTHYLETPYSGTLTFDIKTSAWGGIGLGFAGWGQAFNGEYMQNYIMYTKSFQPSFIVYALDGRQLANFNCEKLKNTCTYETIISHSAVCPGGDAEKEQQDTSFKGTSFKGKESFTPAGSFGCDCGEYHGWPTSISHNGTFTVAIPADVQGIYLKMHTPIEGTGPTGAAFDSDVYNVTYTYSGRKLSCGYTEGQVVSSKPAYGGSSYVNGSFAVSQGMQPGVKTGNGQFLIQSDGVGFLEALSLDGVNAPDLAAPESIENLKKEAVLAERVKVIWEKPADYGTAYYHYVESYDTASGSLLCSSNRVKNTLVSGVKGYYILLNASPNTIVTAENGTFQTDLWKETMVTDRIKYLHVAAVDVAGNIGQTAHLSLIEGVDWKLYTRKLQITEGKNVYPAGNDSYYVKSDGKTPFILQSDGFLDGEASKGYQINASVFESLWESDGKEETGRNLLRTPSYEVQDGEIRTEAEKLSYSTEGETLLERYPYAYTVRRNRNREISAVQKFTLDASASGTAIEVFPRAAADRAGESLWSDREKDRTNGIVLIADGEAPVIKGLETLEDKELINRPEGTVILTVSAEDILSGVGELTATVINTDNHVEETYEADESGRIRIEITEDKPVFSGDFFVTVRAADKVGNVREETAGTTEFALEASVERILEPHEPIFKCGESGVLTVTTWGYAERVEVEFPEEFTALLPDMNRIYTYTAEPGYKKEEKLQFMIPLYAPTNQGFTITVRAYKGNKELEQHPVFSTIEINGSVLEDFRTRLR